MSVKSSFIVDAVGALWRPRFDALALGIDARLRLAWSEKGKIFALSFAKKADDPGEFYRAGARFLRRRKGFCPRFIAFDPHPYFECSRQAAAFKKLFFPKARLVPVFHHVAHAALCAFTHGLEKKFLTLAWDGTGYGADAKVWGGEFLVYQNRSFCRAAHFDYQFLPGNESAVLEPWRMAFAMLYRIYGEKVFSLALPFLKKKSTASLRILIEMMEKGIWAPQTSSAGRLFDAMAAILSVASPGALEACAARGRTKGVYPFEITQAGLCYVIKPDLVFEGVVKDFQRGLCREDIALKFHRTLAESACVTALLLKNKFGSMKIYCSGGVFMNDVLRREMARICASASLEVMFAPKDLTTDAGISIGQIAACALGEKIACA